MTTQAPSRPRPTAQLAKLIVDIATGEKPSTSAAADERPRISTAGTRMFGVGNGGQRRVQDSFRNGEYLESSRFANNERCLRRFFEREALAPVQPVRPRQGARLHQL